MLLPLVDAGICQYSLPPGALCCCLCVRTFAAVKVRLVGGAALAVLQKLAYLVLPSQNAFAGVSSRSLDRSGNLHFR